jgi:hypothetical protein
MQELYTWSVTYSDGTTMYEYDIPEGRGFAEIGEKAVKALEIQPQRDRVLPAYRMDIPDGATPVFFRRRFISLSPKQQAPLASVLAGNEAPDAELFSAVLASPTQTVHCIGWKRGEEEWYHFVFANGALLVTDNFQAV